MPCRPFISFPFRPGSRLALLLADCTALFGSFLLAGALREVFGGTLNVWLHLQMAIFLFVAPVVNFFNDLYSPAPPALHEELRDLAVATSLAYLGMAIFFFLTRTDASPSRFVYLCAWLGSLFTVPLLRAFVRRFWSCKPWWGTPSVIFGEGRLAVRLFRMLKAKPAGLRPAARASCTPLPGPDLPLLRSEEAIAAFAAQHRRPCALVILPAGRTHDPEQVKAVETATRYFPVVVLVPEEFLSGDIPFWVRPVDIGHTVGLKIRQNLLDPRRLALKRIMDVGGSVLAALALSPLLLLIMLCIVVESPGSPFFRQRRIGLQGRPLRILKFRTMVPDAETRLAEYLNASPELRREWERDQKLRHDPRITRMGRFLRRTSLDELPQLWNILCGEMSLVGPRPIVENEIAKYGSAFDAYIRVRPGLTGLWQVSGRNDLSYDQRIRLDRYYIGNWSIWLDLFILAKTVPAALSRKGAY